MRRKHASTCHVMRHAHFVKFRRELLDIKDVIPQVPVSSYCHPRSRWCGEVQPRQCPYWSGQELQVSSFYDSHIIIHRFTILRNPVASEQCFTVDHTVPVGQSGVTQVCCNQLSVKM